MRPVVVIGGFSVSCLVAVYAVIETAQLVWSFMEYAIPGAVS